MIKYYIWLQLCLRTGNSNIKLMLERFRDPRNIYSTDIETLKRSGLFSQFEISRINKIKLSEAEDILNECAKNGIEVICFGSKKYPFCLSVIENPPLVLYVKGVLPDFDNIPSVAIVGPRNVSDYGKRAAYSLGYRLAKAGITVISGGAVGCDTYAHTGALKAGGITVLVMACGILNGYLKENAPLREAISHSGCLISEYPPYKAAAKYSFPVRNRIISGLSLGTAVIEAGEKSGALITARHAYEQGRDVFVVPHSPHEAGFMGSNSLLRDGAKPLLDASDIFNEYISRFPDKINIEKAFSGSIIDSAKKQNNKQIVKNEKIFTETLSKEAKIVYNCLDKPKFLPEDITGTGLSANQIISALTELEMEFMVRALPGGFYEKC